MTICVPGLVSILWSGIIFIAGGERSVYQDLVEVANHFIAGGERLVYRDSEWNESLIIIFIAGG
jgi:hypothetical protein